MSKNTKTQAQTKTSRLTALAAAGALLLLLGVAATPTVSALDTESRAGTIVQITKCLKLNSWNIACAGGLNPGCDVGIYVTLVGWVCVG